MIVAYEVLQNTAGVYRLRVYDECRFLFWTWTVKRWYGADGCPGEGENKRLALIACGEDEIRTTRYRRMGGTMVVIHSANADGK